MHFTATIRDNPPPSRSSSSCLRKSPAVPGHPVCASHRGHRAHGSDSGHSCAAGGRRSWWRCSSPAISWFHPVVLARCSGRRRRRSSADCRRGVVEVFKAFSQHRIQQIWTSSRFLTFQLGFQGFRPGQVPSAGVAAHSSSWTPAAYEGEEPLSSVESESEEEDPDMWVDEYGRRWFRSYQYPGTWRLLGTSKDEDIFWEEPVRVAGERLGVRLLLPAGECVFLVSPLTQRQAEQPPLEAEPGAIVMSVYGGFQKNFLSCVSCSRCSHLEFGALFPYALVSGSHASCVWVLHVEY